MPRDELQAASETLREASEHTEGDLRERLYDQSNRLAQLAARDESPDHGRLDLHMNELYELLNELDGETATLVESARDAVREYRSGVDGV